MKEEISKSNIKEDEQKGKKYQIRNNQKEKIENNSGITLVALVITIIVLLILAGITISLMLGDNGLLNRAEAGKNAHERGEANDINALDRATDYMNSYFTGAGGSKLSETEKIALENNEMEEKKKDEITNPNLKDNDNIKVVIGGKGTEEEVPIPEGFEYKEGKTNTGVVVTANGSEFVWVPVPNISEMAELQDGSTVNYQGVLYNFTGTGEATTATEQTNYGIGTTSYREPDVVTSYDGNTEYLGIMNGILGTTYANANDFKSDLQIEYNKMVASVSKYKGFYVGRYETSVNLTTKTAYSTVNVKPATAAESSANRWYGLYAYQKIMEEKNGYESVESQMIWGSQYDAMLRWAMQGADKAKVNATGNAPHKLSAVYNTGSQTNDKINNIYDLEGNGYEWTAEAYSTDYRSLRGGYYGYSYSPANRYNGVPYYTGTDVCSRPALYIR